MDNIRLTEQKMIPSNDVTADEYWDGSFGVNHSHNQVPVCIIINVYGSQANYVRAQRIHVTQKELGSNDDYNLFEYHIVPCYIGTDKLENIEFNAKYFRGKNVMP